MRNNFNVVPTIHKARSKFDLSHGISTTFNMGELVPLEINEVLPGDTFKSEFTAVVRTSSPFIKPIFGNLYMDIYHFFIPLRLCYEDATKIFGNPSPSAYVDNDLLTVPSFKTKQTVSKGTVADHLDLPLGEIPSGVSVLPFRAFARVYNEWFRNQNVVDETYVQLGDYNVQAENLNNLDWAPDNYMGKLPKVGKKKDYFTSCLPQPQKGASISLPTASGQVPVTNDLSSTSLENQFSPIFRREDGQMIGTANDTGVNPYFAIPTRFGADYYGTSFGQMEVSTIGDVSQQYRNATAYLSLVADLSKGNYGSINDLRFAFQYQRMLELDARGGSRYNEYLIAHYGVQSPDGRLQFTEFLGGGRIPINITQVNNTAQSSNNELGEVGAFSLSSGKSRYIKGFTEHGYVLTVGCVRQIHSYQQGINKMWFRRDRNDFYDPLFAHLGEQPVYSQEIFANSSLDLRSNVLGYNEAWAEYRYKPNSISGQFRSNADNSLDIWHIADYYQNAPVLNDSFVNENSVNIDRVLAVPSQSMDNFILDGWISNSAIRVMPVHSVPGLIDHTY